MAAADAEAKALADAQEAAKEAADAAKMAADNAAAAVAAQAGNAGTNQAAMDAYTEAQDQAAAAMTAYMAAKAASDAAQAATASDDALEAQGMAEARQADAMTAYENAKMYAGMVMEAHDLATAKTGADMAADEAEAFADEAEAAAETVAQLTGDGTEQHTLAKTYAEAARDAATKAREASNRAQASGTSGEAQGHEADAVAERGKAEVAFDKANDRRRESQLAHDTGETLQEARDIIAAQKLAKEAAEKAAARAMYAESHAFYADARADSARAEANRAEAARTNSDAANTHAEAARTAAETAADEHMKAVAENEKAQAAYTAAMGATTADDAVMYQKQAEDAYAKALAAEANALAAWETAGAELLKAEEAADTHVLELFKMANAYHITTAADPDANTDETEAELIGKNKADHISAVNTAIKLAADAANHGGGTVTVMWPYASAGPDGTADTADDVAGAGLLTITLADPAAALTRDDPTTADMDETNFMELMDLGVFDAFEISVDNDTDDDGTLEDGESRTRVLVFTDKEQATAPVAQQIITVNNVAVSNGSRIGGTIGDPGDTDEDRHDFDGSYDHDGDPETMMLVGTFDCVDPTVCSHTRTGTGADTMITSISGYTFTGTVTIAEVPSMEDNTHLTFGVWLTETIDTDATDNETVNQYAFGAFAGGGDQWDQTADGDIGGVKGMATYSGSAAGVHATASMAEYFSGDAILTADFDDEMDTNNGMITGSISNIMAGGNAVADNIYLLLSDQDDPAQAASNITDAGAFSGRTRMGSGTLGDDGEYDYPFNGTWNGNFYNAVADDTNTAGVDESETAPGSVAGTFSTSRMDDPDTMMMDETESWVGAFGAHKE